MNYATIDDQNSKNFEVIKEQDITVLLDKKAVFFVVGTVMDYEVKMLFLLLLLLLLLLLAIMYNYNNVLPILTSPFTVIVCVLYIGDRSSC